MRGPALDTTPRYLKHPVGGAGWCPDGAPLDSGTAMIVHNNVSVLSYQNCRAIGHSLAPGLIAASGWAGAADAGLDGTSGPYGSIPWRQDFSGLVLGPYAPAFTRISADPPGLWPRPVKVVIECTKGVTAGSELTLLVALTSRQGTPQTAPVVARNLKTLTVATHAGDRSVDLLLDPGRPLSPSSEWRSRPSGAAIAATTALTALWIWVGWRSTDVTGYLDAIWAVSAFEVPE